MHLSLGWLLYVQLYALCLVFGDFTYMSHRDDFFSEAFMTYLILNNHLIDVYYKSCYASSDQKSIFK